MLFHVLYSIRERTLEHGRQSENEEKQSPATKAPLTFQFCEFSVKRKHGHANMAKTRPSYGMPANGSELNASPVGKVAVSKRCRHRVGEWFTLMSSKRVTGLEIMRSQEHRSVRSVRELTLRKSDYVVTHSTGCLLTLALASVRANCVYPEQRGEERTIG
ncbi:hypothetical protein WN48_03500 [Eufriesea mexicana]|uniref:Uncharacterized protein n=1 Tax=Eufriesea mexicana TaxID=516756 RepID=A0A310SAN3_9HYME|nr:hypothetical protein WN48_03500 [Eufriesea mexicana]